MVQASFVSALTAVALWSRLAVADDCNPLSSTNCSPDKALATSFAESFSSESDWFETQNDTGEIKYSDDGLEMTLAKRFDNPGLKSKFYIMFGKVEAILKAGPGTGIVSSFFLQSDDLDEIDLEWLGGDDTQFQTNYFSKGNVATYDRGEYHGVSQPQAEFHNYTIDWAMDKTVFYLDGQPVRTLANTTSQGYPQSPMFVKMGIWAGGDPSNAPGTIEWAGGSVDYSQAPFSMYIKKVVVTDYSTGSEYKYGDQSGSWESIEATGGSVYGRYDVAQQEFAALVNGDEISSSSSSASASSTSNSSVSSSTSSASSSNASSTSSASSSNASSTSSRSSSNASSTSSASSSNASSTSSASSSNASSTSSASSSTASSTSSAVSSSTTESPSSATSTSSSSSEFSSTTSKSSTETTSASSTSSEVSLTTSETSTSSKVSTTSEITSKSSATSEVLSTSSGVSATTTAEAASTTESAKSTTRSETTTAASSSATGQSTLSTSISTHSSSLTVQTENDAPIVGYSHGLSGLLAGLALALVY